MQTLSRRPGKLVQMSFGLIAQRAGNRVANSDWRSGRQIEQIESNQARRISVAINTQNIRPRLCERKWTVIGRRVIKVGGYSARRSQVEIRTDVIRNPRVKIQALAGNASKSVVKLIAGVDYRR